MGAVVVSEDATAEELDAARREARRRWEANGKVAAWGCHWFVDWLENVRLAVSRGQRLIVYYFEEQAGKGKVPWDDLASPTVNPWDGIGLGGSQKCEVACLDRLRATEGSQFDYDEVDVQAFLKATGADKAATVKAALGSNSEPAAVWFIALVLSLTLLAFAAVPYVLVAVLP